MLRTKPIALLCKISRGGFSGERLVHVAQADGSERLGLAPMEYCWAADRTRLRPEDPPAGSKVNGLVAVHYLDEIGKDRVVVNTPDGEEFVVPPSAITTRPELEIDSDVLVRS